MTAVSVAVIAFGADSASAANVLRVPQDFATIQAAIDATTPGDTVRVSPGVYNELLDNESKAITIESTGGADVTTIDGGGRGTVVTLTAHPGESPVLRGFTIRDGRGSGVATQGGPALIEDNVITNNVGCGDGGGITVGPSSATIVDNLISHNGECVGSVGGVGGGGSRSRVKEACRS